MGPIPELDHAMVQSIITKNAARGRHAIAPVLNPIPIEPGSIVEDSEYLRNHTALERTEPAFEPTVRCELLFPIIHAAYKNRDIKVGDILYCTLPELNAGLYEGNLRQLENFKTGPDGRQSFYYRKP